MSRCVQYERVVAEERRRGPRTETHPRGGTVLVVASGANHRHLSECLVRAGYNVETVAAEEVAEAGVGGDTPRAAFVDADGCGKRGRDCCGALKERGVPVVVLGTRVGGRRQARALAYGAEVALEKPVRKAELLGTLEAI